MTKRYNAARASLPESLAPGPLDRRMMLGVIGTGLGAILVGCSSTDATLDGTSSGGTSAGGTTAGGGSTAGSTTGTSGGGTTGGSTGVGTTGTSGEPVCVLTQNVTRGPYFIDEAEDPNDQNDVVDSQIPERSDIRSDTEGTAGLQDGLPLNLSLTIYSYANGVCTPLPGAQVDIWHCNAEGLYSDISANSNQGQTGRNFLRGYQITDSNGIVSFITVYPGWYQGRVTHIHLKIRVRDGSQTITTEATTQLFFADATTAAVYGVAPYASKGQNSIQNDGDMVYGSLTNPAANLAALAGNTTNGYSASASIGVALGTLEGE
jgi:protocatechuate 3,4-dioxygenase beta subunit